MNHPKLSLDFPWVLYRVKPDGSRQYWSKTYECWRTLITLWPNDQEISYQSTWCEPEEEE